MKKTGLKKGFTDKSHIESGVTDVYLSKILEAYPNINAEWLVTGEGPMLKEQHKKIPIYNETETGNWTADIAAAANLTHCSKAIEYINVGNQFSNADVAIRYYGTSMKEYPSGCILILDNIKNQHEIIWGEHYTIMYGAYCITKELQPMDVNYIMAYSTNNETYSDGRLRYPPFKILKSEVSHLFLVLGFIEERQPGDFLDITKAAE